MKTRLSESLAVRLTPDERAVVERIATERTASLASVMRWSIRQALAAEMRMGEIVHPVPNLPSAGQV